MYPFTDPVIKRILNEEREEGKAEGMQQGMQQGIRQMLNSLVKDGIITQEEANKRIANVN